MPVSAGKRNNIPCPCCGALVFKHAIKCEGFDYVRCKKCGLVQINPQPLKDEIIERYSSTYGKDYLSYELENEANFLLLQQFGLRDAGFFKLEKALMKKAQRESGEKPSVLDIGCATGALLLFLKDRGWRVTGVEISPSAEYARNKKGLDVRSLPLEENKFPHGSFNVVLASHLIEHLNDPRSFLTETNNILKENGYVFITTPNISGFQARLFGGKWRSAIFDHLCLFSKRTIKKMFKNTGFKTLGIRTWGGIAAGLAPSWIKKPLDSLAKCFGFGDVMIVRAKKIAPV